MIKVKCLSILKICPCTVPEYWDFVHKKNYSIFHISHNNLSLLWPNLMNFFYNKNIDQIKLFFWFFWFSCFQFQRYKTLLKWSLFSDFTTVVYKFHVLIMQLFILKVYLFIFQVIDLPKALAGIRQQRMFMVQTLGQYNFIHKTLIQYLKNTRLI